VSAFTDDDVRAAREAGDRAAELHQPTALHRAGERSRWGCTCQAAYAFQSRDEQAAHIAAESDRAVLDAVAPAIAARALREAAERMDRANERILAVRETHWEGSEQARLTGKAEGVRLAKSFVDEAVRLL
jgi:hypothetical protein